MSKTLSCQHAQHGKLLPENDKKTKTKMKEGAMCKGQWSNQRVVATGTKIELKKLSSCLASLIAQVGRRAGTHRPLAQSIFFNATSMQILPPA